MTVTFRASFVRDLEAIRDARLLRRVAKVVQALESAGSPAEIPQLKQLRGHARLYRVRIGDWRMGLHIDGNQVDCVRMLHRRDIYRYFP